MIAVPVVRPLPASLPTTVLYPCPSVSASKVCKASLPIAVLWSPSMLVCKAS